MSDREDSAAEPRGRAGGGFTAVPRVPRAEEVRLQIERAIEAGEFQPGQRLPSERELGETFGVSRVSVREAMKSLIGQGLVSVQQGRGNFVAKDLDAQYRDSFAAWVGRHAEDLIELYLVRQALDTLAAQRAVRRDDPSALEGIEAAHAAFVDAVGRHAPTAELVAADIAFHEAILEASGSRLLTGLLGDLHRYLDESRRVTMGLERAAERSAEEHEAIVRALRGGEASAIAAAITAHVQSVIDVVRTVADGQRATPAPTEQEV